MEQARQDWVPEHRPAKDVAVRIADRALKSFQKSYSFDEKKGGFAAIKWQCALPLLPMPLAGMAANPLLACLSIKSGDWIRNQRPIHSFKISLPLALSIFYSLNRERKLCPSSSGEFEPPTLASTS